jgi:hypothetical protein
LSTIIPKASLWKLPSRLTRVPFLPTSPPDKQHVRENKKCCD